ncbi:retrovirus-related pol polyprotein from transposon TNT 1-94 [Tanacetum coccineum]
MALISLSFKKIYKPTSNNLRTSSNTSRANQDNSLRINRGTGYENQRVVNVAGARENVAYHKEKMLLCKQEEARVQLNAEQADWKDGTDDETNDQELEAHYMYMAQIQEVTPDAVDNSGPIFDAEPLHKVQNNNDNYNVFAIENEHPEQPESVHDIYMEEQGDTSITIDSLDMCYDREQDDQDDTDELDQERDLLASLIEKLKCEIDDSKNRNKFLETSNKALVDKLKGEIEDFKTKNKSLESSNNYFKEANNELSKTNQLMFKDLKKFQAELDKYHDVNYASKVEIDCAKAKGDLMSYKIESEKSSNEYTRKINDLNQTISDMKKELFAHQETISIMSQEKEAQIKFYKTCEDKELDKVIALEKKVKVALMLAPESSETIRLDKESRSKLSDLIRPFDYDQLDNLYDLFVPQREKSPEQQYFSKPSKMSHTSANNEIFKESFNKQPTLLEKRMDESIKRVIPTTSVSRPQLKSNQFTYRVMSNNSQGKKQEAEDHRRNFKFSNNKTSVTACNDSLNAKTSNVNFVCVACEKCVLNENHNTCVLHYINGVISRTKQPIVVPISTREPKRTVNQYVATPLKRTVASESTNKKPRHTTRKLYEHVSKTSSWWYPKFTPSRYKWKPKSPIGNVHTNLIEIILFIVDFGCSKHMTGNLKLLTNFVEKFLGTVKFRNDQLAPILGYGDLGNDLLTGSRGSDLYSITLQDSSTPNPICLMAKASSSQAWLWHRRLSHLNFDSINLYTWTHFLRSKDETPVVLIDFLTLVQRGLHAQVRTVQTDKGTEFLNKTLHAYFAKEGYSTQSRAYRVFNKRTRIIVETIHVNFDELPQIASDHVSSDPVLQCPTTALEQDSLSPDPQHEENVPQPAETLTTSNELDLLFSPMFDELLRGTTPVVSKSSDVHAADAPDKRQQQNTTSSTSTTAVADTPPLNIQTTPLAPTQTPTVTAIENINQAETHKENA